METKQNQWIIETMKSIDSKKAVGISDRLRQRLELIPNEVSVYNVVIPMRSVYLAAASFALLITINLLAIKINASNIIINFVVGCKHNSFPILTFL